jgi:ABC-2 type transport system permease protein
MKKLLKYELLYLRKTQKFTVFIGLFLFFSIISPLTAKYIKEIISFFLAGTDFALPIPDPTVYTAYEQYTSDLFETIFLVILFMSVSHFIHDKTKGLLPLIFSKPISRNKYLISKYLAFQILLLISLILGYLIFTYYTYALFGEVLFFRGLVMMGLYYIYLVFISAVAMLFSLIFKSYLTAILPTFGVYILFAIFSALGEYGLFQYLPGMVTNNIVAILYEIVDISQILGTLTITLALTFICFYGSLRKINTLEI